MYSLSATNSQHYYRMNKWESQQNSKTKNSSLGRNNISGIKANLHCFHKGLPICLRVGVVESHLLDPCKKLIMQKS